VFCFSFPSGGAGVLFFPTASVSLFRFMFLTFLFSCSVCVFGRARFLPDLVFFVFPPTPVVSCSRFFLVLYFFFSVRSSVVFRFRPCSGGVCVRSSWRSLPEIYGGGLGSCRSSVVHHRVGGEEPWW
jgi:hypothetical protein